MKDEIPFLVCLRMDEAGPDSIVPGSEQTICHLCQSPLWIAPSGKAMQSQRQIQVICKVCLANHPNQDQEIQITRTAIKEFMAEQFQVDAEIVLERPQATYQLLKMMYNMVLSIKRE